MTHRCLRLTLVSSGVILATLGLAAGCVDPATTGPEYPAVEQAPASTSDGSPEITATDPDTGFRNTTLDVQVLGSGFDKGSIATWALDGDTTFATTKITTNSTRYVTSKKLIANITIGPDSPLDLYDVVVATTGGKKGIGLEMFAVSYQLTELGTLGGTQSEAHAINDLGHVVGLSETANGEFHGFLWTPGTGMQDLGYMGKYWQFGVVLASGPLGINEQGSMAGEIRIDGLLGFRRTTTEGVAELPRFGAQWSVAYAINESGEIGGQLQGLPGKTYPVSVIWTSSGYEIVDDQGYAYGVHDLNEAGQAVGWTEIAGGVIRPFFYTRGGSGWTRVEIPAGDPGSLGQAYGLNSSGEAVGIFRRPDGGISGFVWSATAGFAALPSLVPGGRVDAYDINDAGVVAGSVEPSNLADRPAIWSPDGFGNWKLQQLPTGPRNQGFAYSINSRGDVVGSVKTLKGWRAALWTTR
jgi:probable HAF family extracellular repeat protein